jgi:Transglutaminase-like superfamily
MRDIGAISGLDTLITGMPRSERLRIPARVIAASLWAGHRAISKTHRHGAKAGLDFAAGIGPIRKLLPEVQALVAARRLTGDTFLMLRVLHPNALGRPLLRSIAVCAAVRRAGLPAEIVLARSLDAAADRGTAHHAWAALGAEVLTEMPSQLFAYEPIIRLGRTTEGNGAQVRGA